MDDLLKVPQDGGLDLNNQGARVVNSLVVSVLAKGLEDGVGLGNVEDG